MNPNRPRAEYAGVTGLLAILAFLAVAEARAETEVVDGVTWTFSRENGSATVSRADPAEGALAIPAELGGCPVTAIGGQAFSVCRALTEVEIPGSVASIGYRAFAGCRSLRKAYLAEGVSAIGEGAFANCPALAETELPRSLAAIGPGAFESCRALKEIAIPGGVAEIGDGAFANCTELKEIALSGESGAFLLEDGILFGRDGTRLVCFPAGKGGAYAIPEGVERIDAAFAGSGLSAVSFPESLSCIGPRAFEYCGQLGELFLPAGVTNIGERAFRFCGNLERVEIAGNVASIGVEAFNQCGALREVDFGGRVEEIGGNAFAWCHSLENTELPAGLETIGSYAFLCCCSLPSLELPDGLESIGNSAFLRCRMLPGVDIPGSVRSIGWEAFGECPALESVSIGEGLEGDWNAPFLGSGVKAYRIDPRNPAYAERDGVVFSKDMEKLVSFPPGRKGAYRVPPGVREIADYAFQGCGGLTAVGLPAGVVRIGACAFASCGALRSVAIPDGVESIELAAFEGCGGLLSLRIPPSVVFMGEDSCCFGNLNPVLYFPAALRDSLRYSWAALCDEWREGLHFYEDGEGSDATVATLVPVPHAWLGEHAKEALDSTGGDREAAAAWPAANGMPMWECYLAGLNPANATAKFTARISLADGKAEIESVDPDLGNERKYTLRGKKDLMDEEWRDMSGLEDPGAEGYRFFCVGVSLPEE